uniref:U1-type domain-containing protein n=1 Tax=Podarcis muralis TaxID=64176 RepID=A0A670JQH0_PODMU
SNNCSKETKKHRKPRRSRRIRKEENDQEEDMDGPVIDESLLTRDFIYRLRKRPRSYPTAKYTCKLCDTLIESVAFAHKHIKEKRHKKNIKEKQEQQLLTALPPPTPLQIEAIGVAIEKVVQEFGLNNEDLEQRLGVKTAMESVLHQKLPGNTLL